MKRSTLSRGALPAAVVLSFALAACGGGESTDDATASVTTMAHHVLLIDPQHKKVITAEVANRDGRTLVFVRTKLGADRVAEQLRERGVMAASLHGGHSQGLRNRVLGGFRDGTLPVLVATDVAARGIHVDDVSVVLQVDPAADHTALSIEPQLGPASPTGHRNPASPSQCDLQMMPPEEKLPEVDVTAALAPVEEEGEAAAAEAAAAAAEQHRAELSCQRRRAEEEQLAAAEAAASGAAARSGAGRGTGLDRHRSLVATFDAAPGRARPDGSATACGRDLSRRAPPCADAAGRADTDPGAGHHARG